MRKQEEKVLAQAQGEHPPPANSVLLPLPEIPLVLSAGPDERGSDIFENFRRFGLGYLDENGEQLEFSAGTSSDDDSGHRTQSEETEAVVSECSDSESDTADPQPGLTAQGDRLMDYWPYPSKTVSDKLMNHEYRAFENLHTNCPDASLRCS